MSDSSRDAAHAPDDPDNAETSPELDDSRDPAEAISAAEEARHPNDAKNPPVAKPRDASDSGSESRSVDADQTARFAPGWNPGPVPTGQNSPHPPQSPHHPQPPPQSPHHPQQGSPYPGTGSGYPEPGAHHPPQGPPYQSQGSPFPPQGSPSPAQNHGYDPNFAQAGSQPHGIPYPQHSDQYAGQYPGQHPGQHPGPFPGQPQVHSPASTYLSELRRGVTWRAALIPPGLALLAGIILAIVLSVMLTSMEGISSLAEDIGISTDGISYALPFVLLALSLFGSAAFRFNVQMSDMGGASGGIFVYGAPLLVTVVVLGMLWWFTRRSEMKSPSPNRGTTWLRIAITTLSMTIVFFLLQLIFAARFSMTESGELLELEFSAVTVRSFFLPLLAVLVTSICGRIAGHFKGTEAIGASFLRWVIPSALVAWVHLIVTVVILSIVAIFVIPQSLDLPWQTVPAIFINVGLILTLLVHLGGVTASGQGDFDFGADGFSESLTIFSRDAPGQLWLGLIVVIVAVLAATLAATVTRRPYWTVAGEDKHQWASAWKLPLTFCIIWGLLSVLAVPFRMHLEGSAEAASLFDAPGTARAGVGPLAWSFLIFAVWGGIIEVLSRTLGPRLVLTVPSLAKFAAGRAVHPHWGQALRMNEPRFPLIHPDAIVGAAASAGTAAGAGAPAGTGYPNNPNMPSPAGSTPNPAGSTPNHYGPDGGPAYSGPAAPNGVASNTFSSNGVGSNSFSSNGAPPNAFPPSAGYAASGGYSAQVPGAAPAKPFDKKKATLVSVISGAAILVLVGALVVVTQVNGHVFGPEATVEKYFSKLSKGDAEGALKIADVDVPAEQRQLLTNDILGAAKALPKDISVEDAEVDGSAATVSATYDIGGSKSTSTFTLHKSGKKALFFDDWSLQAPELFYLSVQTPGLSKVKVNGIDVDTQESALALPAFPGLYEVGLAEKNDLVSADSIETRAFFADDSQGEDHEPALLAAAPTDAFRTEVNKQVKTLIDSCAKKTVAEPDGCPFGSSLAKSYKATNIKWSISSYPTVSVGSDSTADGYYEPEDSTGPNGGPAWPITTDTTGEAFVTGKYDDFFDDSETFDDTVTFSVNGTAEIVDGKVVINITDNGYGY